MHILYGKWLWILCNYVGMNFLSHILMSNQRVKINTWTYFPYTYLYQAVIEDVTKRVHRFFSSLKFCNNHF